jgi:cobalamin 5''-phosphate synthase/cobalamin synthase
MKKQLHIFLNALMFYTRIPVPRSLPYSDEMLNSATRWFPFIGWMVGGVGAGVFYGLQFVFPANLAVLLSMLATIFITGVFHEDGFADFCDGFGGGYTKEKILTIMKDSRIGTYGSIGLVGMLSVKFLSLTAIDLKMIPLILVVGHALSRLMPVLVIFTSEYARADLESKSKPIGKKGKTTDLLIAIFFGLFWLAFLPLVFSAIIVPALLLVTVVFRRYIVGKLGGYTGDCLGALQQIAEVIFYMGWLAFQHFSV